MKLRILSSHFSSLRISGSPRNIKFCLLLRASRSILISIPTLGYASLCLKPCRIISCAHCSTFWTLPDMEIIFVTLSNKATGLSSVFIFQNSSCMILARLSVTVSNGPPVERLDVSIFCFVQPEIHRPTIRFRTQFASTKWFKCPLLVFPIWKFWLTGFGNI